MDEIPNYNDGDLFDGDSIWNDAFGFEHSFDDDLEMTVERLSEAVDSGQLDRRGDLVAALMQWAWKLSEENRFRESVRYFDEAIILCNILIQEGQIEFRVMCGKAKLYRALEVVARDQSGELPVDLRKTMVYLEGLVAEGESGSRADLAIAQMFLSDYLCTKQKSCSAALAYVDKAIGLWESLVQDKNPEYRLSLAVAYRSRGDVLREIGDAEESIAAFEQSESILRELIYEGDDGAQIELLRDLIHHADTFAHFKDILKAHLQIDEAIDYCRVLQQKKPDEIRGWLPSLISDKARLYRDFWEYEAALKTYDLAIAEFESIQFEESWDDLFEVDEVENDENAGDVEIDKKIEDKDSFSFNEAVYPKSDPRSNWSDFVDSRLAQLQSNRGCILHDLGRFDESEGAFAIATDYYDAILNRGNIDVRIEHCLVRLNYAKLLLDYHHIHSAIIIQRQSIAYLQTCIARGKTRLRGNLAQAYRETGISLHLDNQDDAAQEMFDQSVALGRELIDAGELDKREQFAHSLLVQADFFLERGCYEKSLEGFRESRRIREELLEEGDSLVALPLVRTIFSCARAYHFLDDSQKSLDLNIQALKLLEQIRNKGVISVDDYILEGTRRCLAILLEMNKPDEVLRELEKTFRFIDNIKSEGKVGDLVETEIPILLMYQSHAWRLKNNPDMEIQSLSNAISHWESLLNLSHRMGTQQEEGAAPVLPHLNENPLSHDANTLEKNSRSSVFVTPDAVDVPLNEKRIEYFNELLLSLGALAKVYDEIEDHQREIEVYYKTKELFSRIDQDLDYCEDDYLSNETRIAITLAQLNQHEKAIDVFSKIRERIDSANEIPGFPAKPVSADNQLTVKKGVSPKTTVWCYPHYSRLLAEAGRLEDAIEILTIVIQILRHFIQEGEAELRSTLKSHLQILASYQFKLGQFKEANETTREAEKIDCAAIK